MKSSILLSIMIILSCITGCNSLPQNNKENHKEKLKVISQRPKQIPIWPDGTIPNSKSTPGAEYQRTTKELIAGKPCTIVENVSQPTITIYPPKGKDTGLTVVVFPGGGYMCLAIDLEGTEICEWLISKGITAVLLKYRVPNQKWGKYRESKQALEDAQRTIGLLRFNAKKYKINPNKIGVIGFSAGGHMVAAISTNYKKRLYKKVDAADNESCRPDFAIALYPGHLWYPNTNFILNPNIHVTHKTPPTFLLHAENDPVDNVNNSLVYYIALKNADVPVEMHLYAHGGHAFALRPTNYPISEWPLLVEKWLQSLNRTYLKQNPSSSPCKYHIVQKGETLSKISLDYYGTANKWRKIFDANSKTLKNPNIIATGTKLIIP